jgi:hypothetical protein
MFRGEPPQPGTEPLLTAEQARKTTSKRGAARTTNKGGRRGKGSTAR